MAPTNYLTATVLVLAIGRVLGGPPERSSSATVLTTASGVLTAQWLWSTLWLRRYRFGPLEWLWRWATWARRPGLRAVTSASISSVITSRPTAVEADNPTTTST